MSATIQTNIIFRPQSCNPAPAPSRLAPLYLAECSYGRLGNAFRETDRDTNSRSGIVDLIRTGEIEVVKVIEIDEVAGTCSDVTDEIVAEAMSLREVA